MYVVPGNGCCAPNCTVALLFHDEKYGPELRIRMNSFVAEHWHKRFKYISQ